MTFAAFEKPEDGRPCQGSFYKDIRLVVSVAIDVRGEIKNFESYEYPYVIVLTQECDLVQDDGGREILSKLSSEANGDDAQFNTKVKEGRDRLLPSVLLCPAYPGESFREGSHIPSILLREDPEIVKNPSIKYGVPAKTAKQYERIRSNNESRYHYLGACSELRVPATVLDFKHYFTLPTETLWSTYRGEFHYLAKLKMPYREHVSQRFASFLARVGLPVPHKLIQPQAS